MNIETHQFTGGKSSLHTNRVKREDGARAGRPIAAIPSHPTGLPTQIRPLAPAVFIGVQEGFGGVPSFRCYNLTAQMGEHPPGSTVSEQTLLAMGYQLP